MTPGKAYENGAVGVFSGKYGEIVKVYTVPAILKKYVVGHMLRIPENLFHLKS